MSAILEIEGVNKYFDRFHVLKDINISIPKGKIFGLLGPNGAGKTTLIRIITQITAPDTGSIRFLDENLTGNHVPMMGYLPEERGLYRKMKVWDQAMYLTQLKGLSKQVAEQSLKEWFERFKMTEWHNKRVESLSKGMQQKLQFVISVAHSPKLLILDEPFSGFDPVNTEMIKNEILRLKEEGVTIVFSTHNMASVEELCESIALVNKGECILKGSVEEIKSSFSLNLFEVVFKGSGVAFANQLGIDFEIVDLREHGELKKTIVKAFNGKSSSDLLKRLIDKLEIISFNEKLPSMHDIFIDRVNESTPETAQSDA